MRLSSGRKKIRVGDLLVEAGAITEEELQEALAYQKENGGRIGNVIMEMGFISQELLITVLTTQLGVDYIETKACKLDDNILKLVPENLVNKYKAIPIGYDEYNPNILRVAMVDPMDLNAVDDISIATNAQVEPLLAMEDDIMETIGKYYGNAQAMAAAEQYRQEMESDGLTAAEEEALNEDIENSPVVLLVKQIIEGGVRQRASDIHIEPLESSVRVRYRIDGALKHVMTYDYSLLSGISARIKIIGGMDIAEKRKPQDGRITIMVDRREFDVRVSMLPTVYGEKTVMRLTSKDGLTKPKSALGFDEETLKVFDGILSNPHGIILVTGPTGSGKSTTLYTSLSELNTEDVNIITVEDPVEANIDGINQVQVNVKAELTFASALRSILRQDP
ncbi:MAG: type II secretion system protein GspE, partial [Lachnospiraceae bacterium]|nr:type II secretion system protein GspE [Lachnospiraceae bacterium]